MIRLPLTVLLLAALSAPLLCSASDDRPILTPKPSREAKINGPTVYGARPGHPFLYRIPCTGARPSSFFGPGAAGLAAPRSQPPASSQECTPEKPGVYPVTLLAANAKGRSSRLFRIVVGETLALTPPMGWNDWYTYYDRVTDQVVRQAADAMISSGMADFGYQYVNVDDTWMMKPGSKDPELSGEPRDQQGAIRSNGLFPDMAALAAYIHGKGLKAGLYTSPGPLTCGGYTGSYQHEEIDARTFAAWGFDFLKYDWCSYGDVAPKNLTLADFRKPYDLMGGILKQAGSRYGLQPLPVRHGRRVELGRGFRRPLLAHHRRSGHGERFAAAGFLQHCLRQCRPCQLRRPRPLERSRLHFDRHHRQRLQIR